jgi:prevent-host-death family protein
MAMRKINIHQAKTHLSRLLEDVAKGEPFIIAKSGKPIAKVFPFEVEQNSSHTSSRIGFMKGMYTIPDNFEELEREADAEIAKLFYGEAAE